MGINNDNCPVNEIIKIYTKNNFEYEDEVIEYIKSNIDDNFINNKGVGLEEIYDQI